MTDRHQAAPGRHSKAPGAAATATRGQNTGLSQDRGAILTWPPPEWDRIYARLESRRRGDTDPQGAALERYRQALADFPGPNSGRTHAALLSVANLGRLAGLTAEAVAGDLHTARPDKRGEAREAVRKAFESPDWTPPPRTSPRASRPALDAAAYWRRVETRTAGLDVWSELWERSPVRLLDDVPGDAALLLRTLYQPGDVLYIGGNDEPGIKGGNVRTAGDWWRHLKHGGALGPHWLPNPLSGQPGPKKTGGLSLRCDAAVSRYTFAVVEFDAVAKELQARFWLASRLPVAALVDSGGKSLHGWLRVDCADSEAWQAMRADLLRLLAPLGADPQCWNPARLSRTPGVQRGDDWQRLLYLDPDAGGLAA